METGILRNEKKLPVLQGLILAAGITLRSLTSSVEAIAALMEHLHPLYGGVLRNLSLFVLNHHPNISLTMGQVNIQSQVILRGS